MKRVASLLALLLIAASPQEGGYTTSKGQGDPEVGKAEAPAEKSNNGGQIGGGPGVGGGGKQGLPEENKNNKTKGCCEKGIPKPWAEYNKGVRWTQSLETAIEKAKVDRKLVMVVQYVGRMDLEGC